MFYVKTLKQDFLLSSDVTYYSERAQKILHYPMYNLPSDLYPPAE